MVANYIQLLSKYNGMSKHVRDYFIDLPALVQDFEYVVPISYVFSRIETIKRRTLYGGLVKLHRTNGVLTSSLLDREHITRKRFRELFKIVFDSAISEAILKKLSEAEAVRDKVAHGRPLTAAEARECIAGALEFSEEFDEFVSTTAHFRPYGDMRGFKGAGEPLSKETTKWVLKGMGIPSSAKDE